MKHSKQKAALKGRDAYNVRGIGLWNKKITKGIFNGLMSFPKLPEGIQAIKGNEDIFRRLVIVLNTPNRVIPFVGAGMSANFGFPVWSDFLLKIAENVNVREKVQRRLNAKEYEEAAEEIDASHLHTAIRDTFGRHPLPDKITGPLCFLPSLTVGPVITTNYDRVLERVFEQAGHPFVHVVWEKNKAEQIMRAVRQSFQILIKIHGDADDPVDIILTHAEYQKHYGNLEGTGIGFKDALPLLLQQMLMTSAPLLFLGCSLSHDRTMQVLAKVTKNFAGIVNFAVLEQPATDEEWEARRTFLADHRIEPIWYPRGEHRLIEPLLAYLVHQAPNFAPPRNVLWNMPKDPSVFFTGRQTELSALHTVFQKDTAEGRKQVITGLGGVGKTRLATQYCYLHRANYPIILWIKADTLTDIETGLGKAAGILGLLDNNIQEIPQAVAATQDWLADHTNYLLVLDDVTDFEHVLVALPRGARGRILITTRIQEFESIDVERPLELRTMSLSDAVNFLLHRSGRDIDEEQNRRDGSALAEALGNLPLALEQASAYLQIHTHTTLSEYLADFQKRKLAVFSSNGNDAHANVTTTWNKNFDAISTNVAAVALLNLSAFFGGDAIPNEVVNEYFKKMPSSAIALEVLARYSLIYLNQINHTYDIHRLVQEVIKGRLKPATQAAYALQAVELLAKVFPPPNPSNWQFCDRLLPHALACKSAIVEYNLHSSATWKLLYNLSVYLSERAHYTVAEPVLSLALQQATSGSLDAATLKKYQEESRLVRAMADDATHLSIEDANELSNLAVTYRAQGRYKAAEPLRLQVLAIFERVFGPKSSSTATALDNLGILYQHLGQYEKAEPLHRRALTIYKRLSGPDHLDTAIARNNIGLVYMRLGRYVRAGLLLRKALTSFEQLLGLECRLTAQACDNLGIIYQRQGRFEKAEPLHQCALAFYKGVTGQEQLEMAIILSNLGMLYQNQKRYDRAEVSFQEAIIVCKKLPPPNQSVTIHPHMTHFLTSLGLLYQEQKRYMEAEELFKQALSVAINVLGSLSRPVADAIDYLGRLYQDQGRYKEAEPLRQQALEINKQLLGQSNPYVLRASENYNSLVEIIDQR